MAEAGIKRSLYSTFCRRQGKRSILRCRKAIKTLLVYIGKKTSVVSFFPYVVEEQSKKCFFGVKSNIKLWRIWVNVKNRFSLRIYSVKNCTFVFYSMVITFRFVLYRAFFWFDLHIICWCFYRSTHSIFYTHPPPRFLYSIFFIFLPP